MREGVNKYYSVSLKRKKKWGEGRNKNRETKEDSHPNDLWLVETRYRIIISILGDNFFFNTRTSSQLSMLKGKNKKKKKIV